MADNQNGAVLRTFDSGAGRAAVGEMLPRLKKIGIVPTLVYEEPVIGPLHLNLEIGGLSFRGMHEVRKFTTLVNQLIEAKERT